MILHSIGAPGRCYIAVLIIIVVVLAAIKVARALMLVGTAVLYMSLH
jgi:hypothetical protein